MTGIIIYKSNYGSAKQYAEWLNEETGFQVIEYKKVKKQTIEQADLIIIGCPVFAFKPILSGWIMKKWPLLKNKKVVLYTTSGADKNSPQLIEWFKKSVTPGIIAHIKYFPQGGRLIISSLKPLHRWLMKMGMKMEKNPEVRKGMGKDVDKVNREGLKELLAYIRSA